MRTVSMAFAILVSYLGLTGCATNQLVRLEARDAAATVSTATQAGHTFYVDLVQADEQLYATLYALDPACRPTDSAHAAVLSKAPTWLEKMCAGPTNRLTHESFSVDHAAIDFVGGYAALLTRLALVDEDKEGFTVAQALADYNAFAAAAKANNLNDERTKALSELEAWINELTDDAKSAAAVRELFTSKGSEAQTNMLNLAKGFSSDAVLLGNTEQLLLSISNQAIRDSSVPEAYRYQLAGQISQIAYTDWKNKRRIQACLQSPIKELVKESEVRSVCASQAGSLMALAAYAHGEFGALIHGNLNERQRRRKAMLAYRNFIKAISVLTGIRDAR